MKIGTIVVGCFMIFFLTLNGRFLTPSRLVQWQPSVKPHRILPEFHCTTTEKAYVNDCYTKTANYGIVKHKLTKASVLTTNSKKKERKKEISDIVFFQIFYHFTVSSSQQHDLFFMIFIMSIQLKKTIKKGKKIK